jgi:hypothetical protein
MRDLRPETPVQDHVQRHQRACSCDPFNIGPVGNQVDNLIPFLRSRSPSGQRDRIARRARPVWSEWQSVVDAPPAMYRRSKNLASGARVLGKSTLIAIV